MLVSHGCGCGRCLATQRPVTVHVGPQVSPPTPAPQALLCSHNSPHHNTVVSCNPFRYLFKPGTWPPQLLLEMQPGLNKYDLATMHCVVITARDGLKLPSYLTLPRKTGVPAVLPKCVIGDVPDMDPSLAKAVAASPLKCPLDLKLPLILCVHGGPWSRDTWGADAVVQWLTNRGYAVLQVSSGGGAGLVVRFLQGAGPSCDWYMRNFVLLGLHRAGDKLSASPTLS